QRRAVRRDSALAGLLVELARFRQVLADLVPALEHRGPAAAAIDRLHLGLAGFLEQRGRALRVLDDPLAGQVQLAELDAAAGIARGTGLAEEVHGLGEVGGEAASPVVGERQLLAGHARVAVAALLEEPSGLGQVARGSDPVAVEKAQARAA